MTKHAKPEPKAEPKPEPKKAGPEVDTSLPGKWTIDRCGRLKRIKNQGK